MLTFISLWSFLFIENPFLLKIKPEFNGLLISSSLLTNEDRKKIIVFEETHKIVNPESYSFLNKPITFIAFKMDSLDNCTSLVLYVKTGENFIEELKKEFGSYSSSFSVEGESTDILKKNLSYESIAWKKGRFVMLVSLQEPINELSSDGSNRIAKVWIKELAVSK